MDDAARGEGGVKRVRVGERALYCEETQYPPGNHSCGGCTGCLTAQAVHHIRTVQVDHG
jgi:hypothetical protein